MPWTDRGDLSRRAAHDWCVEWWKEQGLGTLYEGSGSNRSVMCNDAARKALSDGAEALVFLDADTFAPVSQILEAVSLAQNTNRLVHAFTRYARLDQTLTKRVLGMSPAQISPHHLLRASRVTTKHVSGASAIHRDLWNKIGGFDERFTQWGMDDVSFHLAAEVLGGAVERIEGPAFHLHHRKDPNASVRPSRDDARVQLIGRYCAAAGRLPEYGQTRRLGESGYFHVPPDAQPDPDAMRAVLSEPGGPLSTVVPEQVV